MKDLFDNMLEGLDLPSDTELKWQTTVAKRNKSNTGRKRTPEQRKKMSVWQKGKKTGTPHG